MLMYRYIFKINQHTVVYLNIKRFSNKIIALLYYYKKKVQCFK